MSEAAAKRPSKPARAGAPPPPGSALVGERATTRPIFYERFTAPEISRRLDRAAPFRSSTSSTATTPATWPMVESNSVALVVTSPPYFAGKAYEEASARAACPASYFEYLEMLSDVFAECVRVLEPGGRIAVNVANLGRKPYRSLAGDVTDILQDRPRAAAARRGRLVEGPRRRRVVRVGHFQRPANPVLRDVTERIVVASQGPVRPGARAAKRRAAAGLPHERHDHHATSSWRPPLDLWEIPPESATRVGHPAPFPVELPAPAHRALHLRATTSCSTRSWARAPPRSRRLRTGRHFVGFDTDADYVGSAEAASREQGALGLGDGSRPVRIEANGVARRTQTFSTRSPVADVRDAR